MMPLKTKLLIIYHGIYVDGSSSYYERHLGRVWGIKQRGPDKDINIKITKRGSFTGINITIIL